MPIFFGKRLPIVTPGQVAVMVEDQIPPPVSFAGFKSGMGMMKDDDTGDLKIGKGAVEIKGTIYTLSAPVEISLAGLDPLDVYFVFISAPEEGTALASENFHLSQAAYEYESDDGSYYNDQDQRYIGQVETDGSGVVNAWDIYSVIDMVHPVDKTRVPTGTGLTSDQAKKYAIIFG